MSWGGAIPDSCGVPTTETQQQHWPSHKLPEFVFPAVEEAPSKGEHRKRMEAGSVAQGSRPPWRRGRRGPGVGVRVAALELEQRAGLLGLQCSAGALLRGSPAVTSN
jgi:hypothetical protein